MSPAPPAEFEISTNRSGARGRRGTVSNTRLTSRQKEYRMTRVGNFRGSSPLANFLRTSLRSNWIKESQGKWINPFGGKKGGSMNVLREVSPRFRGIYGSEEGTDTSRRGDETLETLFTR